jgi:predicted ATPase
MQSRLIIRNFGPIEFVDLDLRNVNIFIGPQASGKSAIAKIFTIFKAPRKFFSNIIGGKISADESFISALDEYNIASFLKSNTEIFFESELHNLSYSKNKLDYSPKLLKRLQNIEALGNKFDKNQNIVKDSITKICEIFVWIKIRSELLLETKEEAEEFTPLENILRFKELSKNDFKGILALAYKVEDYLATSTSLYIPAERNFVNIIKSSSLNLQLNNVPIPKNILAFGAELEKSVVTDIDLRFLKEGLSYKNINKEDRIFFNETESIKLTEAASGIQSVLPILIPLKEKNQHSRFEHRSFVIEEPELNLFPLAQYELIKHLESNRVETFGEDAGTIHTYTTHSPYILSSFNNLLYASSVYGSLQKKILLSKDEKDLSDKTDKKIINTGRVINKIVQTRINPDIFTAYQIFNGKAESIFNRKSGLIDNNFIDDSSDKISDDFDALMELLND